MCFISLKCTNHKNYRNKVYDLKRQVEKLTAEYFTTVSLIRLKFLALNSKKNFKILKIKTKSGTKMRYD